MPTAGVVSHLLQELYSAPLEPERWQSFFGSLCEATCCEMGVFTTSSLAGSEALAGGGIHFTPEPLQLYNAHFGNIDPFIAPVRRNLRRAVIEDQELVSRNDILKTEFYNDLLSPFGLHHVTVVPCLFNSEREDYVTLFRGNRHGRMDTESTQLISFLLPHMTNALRTHHVLAEANVRLHLLAMALDSIPAAAFVLNALGSVVQMNRRAEALTRADDGMTLRRGQLGARKQTEDGKLKALIKVAVSSNGVTAGVNADHDPFSQSIRISRSGKPALLATVTALPESMPQASSDAFVLCLISDPAQCAASIGNSLAVLYNLSPIERKIAELVLNGSEAKEIGASLGMTYDTVRFHMKCIFRKTGTNKQSQLVGLMTRLAMQRISD